jgi:hypothetical protein
MLHASKSALKFALQWVTVVTYGYIRRRDMLTINLRDAKAGFSSLVDEAVKGRS